jgi:hypothetical protein
VTLAEILDFHEDGTGALAELLPYIEQQLHVGDGFEDRDGMGGVSWKMLTAPSRTHASVAFQADITDGTSNTLLAGAALPAVQLAAFGDGSVRPGGPGHRPLDRGLHFRNAEFFSGLTAVDPSSPNNTGWSGLFNFIDPDGNSLTGVLIGLLRNQAAARKATGGPMLQGILIGQDGTGEFAGAPGTGEVQIHWGDGLRGPFDATLHLKPFASESKK